jgi:hypothetical protein
MPALTRKRINDRPETWHVHYAGVRVGVIVGRSGAPPSSDQWQWHCGSACSGPVPDWVLACFDPRWPNLFFAVACFDFDAGQNRNTE